MKKIYTMFNNAIYMMVDLKKVDQHCICKTFAQDMLELVKYFPQFQKVYYHKYGTVVLDDKSRKKIMAILAKLRALSSSGQVTDHIKLAILSCEKVCPELAEIMVLKLPWCIKNVAVLKYS